MQAIILAAGMGRRLRDLTKDNTKCMVKVNGEPLIERDENYKPDTKKSEKGFLSKKQKV